MTQHPVDQPARVMTNVPCGTVKQPTRRCGAPACGQPARPGQRSCRACNAKAQRDYRARQTQAHRTAAWAGSRLAGEMLRELGRDERQRLT